MNWIATAVYLVTFAALCSGVCWMVASAPIMWPFLFLLLPMAAWASVDIYFIWKE